MLANGYCQLLIATISRHPGTLFFGGRGLKSQPLEKSEAFLRSYNVDLAKTCQTIMPHDWLVLSVA